MIRCRSTFSWLACAMGCLAAGPAGRSAAGDWAGFLGGPYRSASVDEKGLLSTWPADGPPLCWKANGLGRSFSEVLVVGDNVFAWGGTGRFDGLLQCLDLATGKPRWKVSLSLDRDGGGADSTPAWDAGRLYLQARGVVACLDAGDGRVLWRADLHKLLREAGVTPVRVPEGGYGGAWVQSPLVWEGKVVVVLGQPRALVMALDAGTGKLRWLSKGEKQAIGRSWSSASLVRCGKRSVILAPCAGDLVAVDAADGKVLWEERSYAPEASRNGVLYTWACPPVCSDGFLFVFAGYREPAWSTFRLAADGAGVERAWNKPRLAPKQENVVVVNGLMFGSGCVYWGDLEENPGFLYEGKPLKQLPPGTLDKWRARGRKNPERPILSGRPGTLLVCQELKTGAVLGARLVGEFVGHSHHLVTHADGRLYVAVSGMPDAVYLVEASPALTVHGTLGLNMPELLKSQPGAGTRGFFTRPQVSHGRCLLRIMDQMSVYDLRPRR